MRRQKEETSKHSELEVAIGRIGPGWAGPTVGRAKTGPNKN